MADTMVEGLSGKEFKQLVLKKVELALDSSCDLRDVDNFDSVSGEIKLSLQGYAMDTIKEEFTIPIVAKVDPPVSTEGIIVTPINVEQTIEIPRELDLEIVRDQLTEEAPTPVVDETEESRMPARLKRKYTRRSSLEVPSMPLGGAVDLNEEI